MDTLLPIQDAQSTLLILDLIKTPEKYGDHIRHFTTAVILASVYGERVTESRVKEHYRVHHEFTAVMEPGATPPVDMFPFLKWMPECMAGWKRKANRVSRNQRGFFVKLLEDAKTRIANGGEECLINEVLREQVKLGLSEMEMAYIGGIFVSVDFSTPSIPR
jgi:hypothetical protein